MTPRRLAHAVICLAVLGLLAAIVAALTGSATAAWLAAGALFMLIITGILLASELRPQQRHRVK